MKFTIKVYRTLMIIETMSFNQFKWNYTIAMQKAATELDRLSDSIIFIKEIASPNFDFIRYYQYVN